MNSRSASASTSNLRHNPPTTTLDQSTPVSCPSVSCPKCEAPPAPKPVVAEFTHPKPIPPFRLRQDLGEILEKEGLKFGVELGVQKGEFAEQILNRWKSATKYVLVDIWAHLEHYHDMANVGNNEQEELFRQTKNRLAPFMAKPDLIEICRDFTTKCAVKYPDDHFDFIYVDARHDRMGVLQDMEAWWPKLKRNGIMAGHDYVTQYELNIHSPGQDWTVNVDGSKDETKMVVRGAVDDFFSKEPHVRQVTVSYREPMWNSWAVRK
jgi:hypothetical protein